MRTLSESGIARCAGCGRPGGEGELDRDGLCVECADEACAEAHEQEHAPPCWCEVCERVRARAANEARKREARALAELGGLSAFGREVLGW